jgi:hypothetical protein
VASTSRYHERGKCKSDPGKITKADLIVQGVHGHATHYNARVCAGCSSGPLTMKWMAQFPELQNLDVMLMDCDVDFAQVKTQFKPKALIRTHDFKSRANPKTATLYTDFPDGKRVLHHADSWVLDPPKKACGVCRARRNRHVERPVAYRAEER